jgi:hypothetical protein
MTQKELIQKYPKIFLSGEVDPRYPFPMFGIECGSGWYPLISILCNSIQSSIDQELKYYPEKETHQVHAVQVKEKFGGLRFYVDSATDDQNAWISFAEDLSYHICEDCGILSETPLLKSDYGWYSSICPECKAKKETNRYIYPTKFYKFLFQRWYREHMINKKIVKPLKKLKSIIYKFLFTHKVNG